MAITNRKLSYDFLFFLLFLALWKTWGREGLGPLRPLPLDGPWCQTMTFSWKTVIRISVGCQNFILPSQGGILLEPYVLHEERIIMLLNAWRKWRWRIVLVSHIRFGTRSLRQNLCKQNEQTDWLNRQIKNYSENTWQCFISSKILFVFYRHIRTTLMWSARL